MPLIESLPDDLLHIDPPLSPKRLHHASTLISAELPPNPPPHPFLPQAYTPTFPPLTTTAHALIAQTGKPRSPAEGIDMARYEAPTLPDEVLDSAGADGLDEADRKTRVRKVLRQAYIAQEYLEQRGRTLELLDRHGRNAWLIGNAGVEEVVRRVEGEVKGLREEAQGVEGERRRLQEGAKGEVEALEESWRAGLGRAIEAEVAAQRLRGEAIERRKRGGGWG